MMTEHRLPRLGKLLSADTPLNPVRPLPPVGGNPALHGIEPDEKDVTRLWGARWPYGGVRHHARREDPAGRAAGHRDIRRGEVTIVFDPKGDADLMKRVWAEAHRAGRGDKLYIFHLGWPEISARYNAVGRFGRVSEVASRVAGQLSGEGTARHFANLPGGSSTSSPVRWSPR